MMSTFHVRNHVNWSRMDPIPFPREHAGNAVPPRQLDSMQFALLALGLADRRMKHLARTLGCLGYFESDEDGPRAA